MTTFCQTLFTMTAAASIAALAVMILRLLLKKAPRWLTCALWLVVFLRMVCPVSLDLPVSLMPASITSGAAAERVIPTTITPTVPETTPAQSAPAAAEEAEPAAAAPAANPEPASPGLDRNDFLFAVWVMGAAGMVLWGAVSYLRLRRRISEAVRLEGNLYETDRIDTPFVCGFFRPRIYLPVGLDPTDRKYVVLHEQAHIRRKDHLTKPLAYLALCVHWFNPVLWLAFRLFCRDVEGACDQAVIRNFDRTDTAGYAAALLHLGRRRTLPQAVPLAFGEENAKRRVKGVLTYKKPAFWVLLAAVILCVTASVLLLSGHQAGTRLDGHKIASAQVVEVLSIDGQTKSTTVDLPKDLTEQLLRIVENSGHDAFTEHTSVTTLPDRTVILTGADGETVYYLICTTGEPFRLPTLIRSVQQDGETTWESANLNLLFEMEDVLRANSLAGSQTQTYLNWEDQLEQYLFLSRADDLYALRTTLQDLTGCKAIFQALNPEAVLGPYTLEVQGDSIALRLEQTFSAESLEWDFAYYAAHLILPLIDGANALILNLPDGSGFTYERNMDSRITDPTLTNYQSLYYECHEAMTCYAPGRPSGSAYSIETVLYADPDAPLSNLPLSASDLTDYPQRRFILRADVFAIRPVGDPYAAPLYDEVLFEHPVYQAMDRNGQLTSYALENPNLGDIHYAVPGVGYAQSGISEPASFVFTTPEGEIIDLTPVDQEYYSLAILDQDGTDTGFRFCSILGGETYLAFYSQDEGQPLLRYLFQITPDPG